MDWTLTIRTRGRQTDFVEQFHRHQNVYNQSLIMVKASERWLGVCVDLLISLFIITVAIAAILVTEDAAFTGLGFMSSKLRLWFSTPSENHLMSRIL